MQGLSPLSSPPRPPAAPPTRAPEPDLPEDRVSLSASTRWGAVGLAALGVVGVAAGFQSCSAPPQAQIQIQSPPSQTWVSTSNEVELGKQVAQALEKETPLWTNPQAQQRLERLGRGLVEGSSRPDLPYTFKLLDTQAVNAMALPGGTIYATRGLMEKFSDDGELAFVLGHELAHVEQRHSVDVLVRTLGRKALTLPLHFRQWPIARAALNAGDQLIANRYSQAAETEADRLGQLHLVRMGIDPDKAVDAMQRLRSLNHNHDVPVKLEQIFSDHPPTQQREQALRKWAQELKTQPRH